MGGPVTGGQQYTVNDGGGREAFLSNTGKFSMLPAAKKYTMDCAKLRYDYLRPSIEGDAKKSTPQRRN